MNYKYLIADCIVFEPVENSISLYNTDRKETTKYDIGENSKDILLELIKSKIYLSTEELLENVWRKKRKSEVDTTSVRQAVSKLRKSLNLVVPDVDIIKTIPRKGYLLNAKVKIVNEELNGYSLNKKSLTPWVVFIWLSIFVFTVVFTYIFSSHDTMRSDNISLVKVEDIEPLNNGLKIVRLERHPINEELLPLSEQCIYELSLLRADTIVIHTRAEGHLSLTAFYEKPIKKHETFRLILSYSDDAKGSYRCGGF